MEGTLGWGVLGWVFLATDSERSLACSMFIWEFLRDRHPWKGGMGMAQAEGKVGLSMQTQTHPTRHSGAVEPSDVPKLSEVGQAAIPTHG